jgi:hypothetical protein
MAIVHDSTSLRFSIRSWNVLPVTVRIENPDMSEALLAEASVPSVSFNPHRVPPAKMITPFSCLSCCHRSVYQVVRCCSGVRLVHCHCCIIPLACHSRTSHRDTLQSIAASLLPIDHQTQQPFDRQHKTWQRCASIRNTPNDKCDVMTHRHTDTQTYNCVQCGPS